MSQIHRYSDGQMTERLKSNECQEEKDSITLNKPEECSMELSTTTSTVPMTTKHKRKSAIVTVESHQANKKRISNGKLKTVNKTTQVMKSSKTSDQVLTTKEKDYK